jgi:hypothetical protein
LNIRIRTWSSKPMFCIQQFSMLHWVRVSIFSLHDTSTYHVCYNLQHLDRSVSIYQDWLHWWVRNDRLANHDRCNFCLRTFHLSFFFSLMKAFSQYVLLNCSHQWHSFNSVWILNLCHLSYNIFFFIYCE